MWSRVSNEAAEKGFSFEILGKALMAISRTEVPKVQAMEIIFITSGKHDLERLDDIAQQVRLISKDIVREIWLAKGYDILECTLSWDCSTCTDKAVCDEIREVIKVRKKKVKKTKKAAKY